MINSKLNKKRVCRFGFYFMKSSSDQTKAIFAYVFDILFSFLDGTLSTGLNPFGAHIFSFLDLTVDLVAFFLRRMTLDFDFEDVWSPDVEGPGSVRVLFASSAEEEEIVTALIADRDTLAEGALDRGEVGYFSETVSCDVRVFNFCFTC